MHVLPEMSAFGVANFVPFIEEKKITRLLVVPTLLKALVEDIQDPAMTYARV